MIDSILDQNLFREIAETTQSQIATSDVSSNAYPELVYLSKIIFRTRTTYLVLKTSTRTSIDHHSKLAVIFLHLRKIRKI